MAAGFHGSWLTVLLIAAIKHGLEPVIVLAGRRESLAVSRSFAHRFKAM